MIVTTYDLDERAAARTGFGLPLRRFDHDDGRREQELVPGDTVYHADNGGSGYGTVIAVSCAQTTVLWSLGPASPRYDPLGFDEDIYVPVRKGRPPPVQGPEKDALDLRHVIGMICGMLGRAKS